MAALNIFKYLYDVFHNVIKRNGIIASFVCAMFVPIFRIVVEVATFIL